MVPGLGRDGGSEIHFDGVIRSWRAEQRRGAGLDKSKDWIGEAWVEIAIDDGVT